MSLVIYYLKQVLYRNKKWKAKNPTEQEMKDEVEIFVERLLAVLEPYYQKQRELKNETK